MTSGRARAPDTFRLCVEREVRPVIHHVMALAEARAGFEAMAGGELLGKIVFTTGAGA